MKNSLSSQPYWIRFVVVALNLDLDSHLAVAGFDVEQLPHEVHLDRGGQDDDHDLQQGPLLHVGVVVDDQGVVAGFLVARVRLVLEHGIQIALHGGYRVLEKEGRIEGKLVVHTYFVNDKRRARKHKR